MVTRRNVIGGIAGIIAAQTAPAFGLAGAASATSPRARSLITARNLALGGGKKLPYDYEVEWIASADDSVSRRFSTGVKLTTSHTMRGEFVKWGPTTYAAFSAVGCSNGGASRYFVGSSNGTTQDSFRFLFLSDTSSPPVTVLSGLPRGSTISFDVGYLTGVINGIDVVTSGGGYNATEPIEIGYRIKLKWWQILLNGVVVHDYIPVVKDGVGVIYDRVNNAFLSYKGATKVGDRKSELVSGQ